MKKPDVIDLDTAREPVPPTALDPFLAANRILRTAALATVLARWRYRATLQPDADWAEAGAHLDAFVSRNSDDYGLLIDWFFRIDTPIWVQARIDIMSTLINVDQDIAEREPEPPMPEAA